MASARRQGGSRTGTLLVLSGVIGVLGVTFVAGVWTGRHWPLLVGGTPPPVTGEAPANGREPAPRPKQAEPLPALTFYQELTAPLTAPPPVPRPARPPRQQPEARREVDKSPEPPPPTAPTAAPTSGATYTVQVGAYHQRTPAETLRATLAAAGHDARLVEAPTAAGVRYRVQVGTFPTREAARETATRLAAERSLRAFVTTR